MYIDTHAHIYTSDFEGEYDEIISRAQDAKVNHVVMPNIDIESWDQVRSLYNSYPSICHPMVGLHPCSVKEDYKEVLDTLYPYLDDLSVVGVGEIGVDLYWDKTYKKAQEEAFRLQIGWALERNYPIAIHSRESIDITISIVEEMQDGTLTGIFHCFSEGMEEAKRIMDVGFCMGIGGVSTFKKSQALRDTIAEIPLEHLVLETDAPYLSPSPKRGKRNESSYIPYIAEVVAISQKCSLEEVASMTTANARTLFNLE